MSGLAFTGHAHHCLPFWKRVVSCHNNSIIPNAECALQREDFLECRHGYKQSQINFLIEHEKKKQKVVRLPVYNPLTDNFESTFQKTEGKVFLASTTKQYFRPPQPEDTKYT